MKKFLKDYHKLIEELSENELFEKHKELVTLCNKITDKVIAEYFENKENLIISDDEINEVLVVRNRINHNLETLFQKYEDKNLLSLFSNTIRVIMTFLLCYSNSNGFTPLLLNYKCENEKEVEIIEALLKSDAGLYELVDIDGVIITLRNVITDEVFDCYDPMFIAFSNQYDIRGNHYLCTRIINCDQISFLSYTIIIKSDDNRIINAIEHFKENGFDNISFIDMINDAIPNCLM